MALAACATVPGGPPAVQTAESISFAVEPCFGFCPDFDITVDAAGNGTYRGENFVAQKGEHPFRATPSQFDAFAARLAPFRPARSVQYGYENCDGMVATDSPSVRVTWHDADGGSTTLDWYMGCRQPGLAERSEQIYKAWQELPLEALVGADEDRMDYAPR